MKKRFKLLGLLAAFSLFAASAAAQRRIDNRGQCSGPIYNAKDVTRRARILTQPDFKAIYDAFGHDVHARVSVEAVLCRSGQVTDIRVVESAPPDVGEFVVRAVYLMRFAPAEMNWHTVSQRQRFEFSINDTGSSKEVDPAAGADRLIEQLDIVGNRRISAEQIRSWIKTRPGDQYNFDQITRDFNAVLATGYFDKLGSRVTTEDGVRGGIGVTFFVVELPLISEVKFKGLDPVYQLAVLDALLKAHIDLRKGATCDAAKVKIAASAIRQLLESKGWQGVRVEAVTENLSSSDVVITFVITDYKAHS